VAQLSSLGHITRMELLTTRDGKEVWLHQIERPFVFEPPFPRRRFVAIVFSNDETVTDAERQTVTRALFASGCRYGVFAGHACHLWEFALDTACIESDPNYQPSDEAFTMTTSHKDESVEDVMFFGLMNTSFGSHDFDRFLVLFAGHRAGLREAVAAGIRSVWYESHGA
jgi:hypothetical protein